MSIISALTKKNLSWFSYMSSHFAGFSISSVAWQWHFFSDGPWNWKWFYYPRRPRKVMNMFMKRFSCVKDCILLTTPNIWKYVYVCVSLYIYNICKWYTCLVGDVLLSGVLIHCLIRFSIPTFATTVFCKSLVLLYICK